MRVAFASALVLLLVAAGCNQAAPAAPTAAPAAPKAPAAPAAAAKTVKFTAIDALTGQSALYGTRQANGTKLYAKQINDAGGFKDSAGNSYKIEIDVQDMANSKEQAIALLQKAVGDPTVLGVIGPTNSVGYAPMVPVAGQVKLSIMGTGSGASIPQWNPYAHRINVVPTLATPIMMKLLNDKFKIGKLAILVDITQDGQKTDGETARDLASKVGYQVVAYESMRGGDPDVRAQLTKIKAANPDWIYYAVATAADGATVLNQAYELGLGDKQKMTGFSQWDNNPAVWDNSQGKPKGGYSWTAAIDISSDDPNVKKFLSEYKAGFNEDASIYSLYGHDALGTYVDAVKRAGTNTDREKFVAALNQTKDLGGLLATRPTFIATNGENQTPLIKVTRSVDKMKSEDVK